MPGPSSNNYMIGYHYTSFENWQFIKKEGLIPYPCLNSTMVEQGIVVMGIWLWVKKPVGLSHFGNVLYEASDKGVDRVVCLKVKYNPLNEAKHEGRKLVIRHLGTINKLVYHRDALSFINATKIPVENIELIGDYDLRKLIT